MTATSPAAATAVALAYMDRSRAPAEAFMATVHEVTEEWHRGRALADRPGGSRRVRVMNMVVPHRRR